MKLCSCALLLVAVVGLLISGNALPLDGHQDVEGIELEDSDVLHVATGVEKLKKGFAAAAHAHADEPYRSAASRLSSVTTSSLGGVHWARDSKPQDPPDEPPQATAGADQSSVHEPIATPLTAPHDQDERSHDPSLDGPRRQHKEAMHEDFMTSPVRAVSSAQ